jgi:hypothetical protein
VNARNQVRGVLMADGPLLGCPHCGKPIAFAQELAGRTAACPHCRGPFTMPAAPPQPAAHPPQLPAPTQQPAPPQRKPTPSLGFNPDEAPSTYRPGERHGQEKFCYPNAETTSLIVCISGIVFTLMLAGFLTLAFIVPTFQIPGTRAFFEAFIASIGVLAILVGGIAGSLLFRHLVLVVVDSARHARNRRVDG